MVVGGQKYSQIQIQLFIQIWGSRPEVFTNTKIQIWVLEARC